MKTCFEPRGSHLTSAQDNPHGKVVRPGEAYSEPLRICQINQPVFPKSPADKCCASLVQLWMVCVSGRWRMRQDFLPLAHFPLKATSSPPFSLFFESRQLRKCLAAIPGGKSLELNLSPSKSTYDDRVLICASNYWSLIMLHWNQCGTIKYTPPSQGWDPSVIPLLLTLVVTLFPVLLKSELCQRLRVLPFRHLSFSAHA